MKAPVEPSRREVLGTVAVLVLASGFLPGAMERALAASPASVTTKPIFWDISKSLTGQPEPDPGLGNRLYAVLDENYHDLDAKLTLVSNLLAKQDSGSGLRQAAEAQQAGLGALVDDLVNGWYLGVVGPPAKRRCIAFENIVSYRVVDKALPIPSYCGGAPAFWSVRPAGI